jgi:hypothetical protein
VFEAFKCEYVDVGDATLQYDTAPTGHRRGSMPRDDAVS